MTSISTDVAPFSFSSGAICAVLMRTVFAILMECSSQMLDHAVLAVGYGISPSKQKYIIVKNSWGSDWGMDGYIYMSAEIPNMCGIASCASYPTVLPKGKHGCAK